MIFYYLMKVDPRERPTARDVRQHAWFYDVKYDVDLDSFEISRFSRCRESLPFRWVERNDDKNFLHWY